MKRETFMWLFGLLGLLVLATVASAQQKKPPLAKGGVVSGSIFAITEGGDLKPARMSHVYVLYTSRIVKTANANPEDMTAGAAWLDNHNKAMEDYTKYLVQEGMPDSLSSSQREGLRRMMCRKHLLTYTTALTATVEWSTSNNGDRIWQILFADADENGVFKVTVLHPGIYTILAEGRAGFNDAFWDLKNVAVGSGVTKTVKLSRPEESCLPLL
jgi:hypothetical protein